MEAVEVRYWMPIPMESVATATVGRKGLVRRYES